MKIFASIFVLYFVGVLSNIADEESDDRDYLKHCIEESGVDQNAVDKLQDKIWDMDNKKLQCFMKCFMLQIGVINNDGTINEANMKEKISHEFSKERIDEVIMKCKDPKGADACENSLLMLKCLHDNTPSMQKDEDS
ncbi:general odorant-binding protein 56d-like [Cotesia glomerata]|uniref:Uncharacterized protein n=1 Tax=Cotesia glomerata TaxID=32391 RepID=A0AAV7HZ79_COTGL|nr:general odorant-binding protein 56d-like [Cotesia glomerata]KAH0540527.1 hypothetical protein KQX54_018017 [Cotesia glomerata]